MKQRTKDVSNDDCLLAHNAVYPETFRDYVLILTQTEVLCAVCVHRTVLSVNMQCSQYDRVTVLLSASHLTQRLTMNNPAAKTGSIY